MNGLSYERARKTVSLCLFVSREMFEKINFQYAISNNIQKLFSFRCCLTNEILWRNMYFVSIAVRKKTDPKRIRKKRREIDNDNGLIATNDCDFEQNLP
ncbi:hypothetical protein QR98_0013820 [Sarcoptes scabiei]|uniref:Uncharacterized protein n=1 Tax=Sarcoptes scabiei TaxID=52283 RepID=A0A131ZVY9_SARSC|nr:hypothetical protein QR98_0013820 [Sarcoptes scabiei]